MKSRDNSHRIKIISGLVILIVVHFLLRWIMARSPFLAESYYDEAVTGEMALHILKGEHQLFFWGQPYMGSLEAYLNAIVILFIGPSAAALRLSDTLISIFILFLVNRIGTLAGDWKVGLLSAAYWALSPLYLSIIGLLATGGHVEACAFGAFIILSISLLVFKSSKNSIALAWLIGIIAGIAWWSSLLSAPFLLAGALGLAIAQPRLLLGRIPWMGLAGFLIGSTPFWLWEFLHNFSTFDFFEGHGVGIFKQLWSGLYTVLRFSFFQSSLGDWWDGHSVLPSVPSFLAWTVFIFIYLPAFFLSLFIIVHWIRRIFSLRNPFQDPKDLVVVTFWILILAFSTSEQGANGSLRYSLSLYIPFTILLALWLGKVFQLRKVLGVATLIGLLSFNLFLHNLFLNEFKNLPFRPVDKLIKALKDHGIRYAYADNRISQVLTFESGEKIICADYYGQRNFNYLRTVDAVPAKEVAIITHQKLGNPYPETMSAALRLLGGSYKQVEVGDYVFWFDFKEPTDNLKSLPPQDWRITASQEQGQVELIKDRDLLTSWKIVKRAGDYLSVDLKRPKRLARISILPGPIGFGLPSGFNLEISLDQKKWEKIAQLSANDMLAGLYWYHGRPRLDQNPRLQITFAPRPARFIRMTNLTNPDDPKESWTIAELFIYEASPTPVKPSEKAVEAYSQANRAMDHWMDDPTGPHPLFPGVNLDVRRKQVNWRTVIQSLQRAIQEAPDWEDAHQLFGEAVDWGGLWNMGEKQIKKKPLNYNTLFPQEKLSRISPTQLRVFANTNNAEAGLAIDGNPLTRWGSLKGQEPGMFFQINLGADYLVKGFSLFFGSSINDYPRNLKIMGSPDEKHWQEIQANSHTYYAFAENQIYKKTYYFFSPIKIRTLKLIQEGQDPVFWWSIYEAEVLGIRSNPPMRIVKSNYLNDGKLFNNGRPVDLIEIDKEDDFDVLLNNIISSGYYDSSYFDSHIDYKEGELKFDSFYLSSILRFLEPKSLLELGCGRGDVLFLLGLNRKIKVHGIEFSQDVLKKIWPPLGDKVGHGDILEVCKKYYNQKISFDTFCAFDLWEHIHPKKFHDYIDSVVSLAEKDALFFFTIPAFGEDRVFGEVFPLELEENRNKFNQRFPFDFLNAECIDPAIPAKGHLIWAHTEWWQKQFERHGLIRAEGLERNIHTYFDEHLFYARKSFYIFYLNTQDARRRANRLSNNSLTLYRKWRLMVAQQELICRFTKNRGKSFIDLEELKLTINHAEFYMILDLKNRIERWIRKLLPEEKTGGFVRPILSLSNRLTNKCLNAYVKISKRRHYLVK